MVSKVFVDTDVIIDFLIDRQPHAQAATLLFDLADKQRILLCASTLCFNNVHYIVKKVLGDRQAREVIDELLELIEVLNVSKSDLKYAAGSDFKDFEDAIQHSVALSDPEIKSLITRNTKDYLKSKIAVFDPVTFIELFKNE